MIGIPSIELAKSWVKTPLQSPRKSALILLSEIPVPMGVSLMIVLTDTIAVSTVSVRSALWGKFEIGAVLHAGNARRSAKSIRKKAVPI